MDKEALWDFIKHPQSNVDCYSPVKFNTEGNIDEMWKTFNKIVDERTRERHVDTYVTCKDIKKFDKESKRRAKENKASSIKNAQDNVSELEREISYYENALKTEQLSKEEKKVYKDAIENAKEDIARSKFNISEYKHTLPLDAPYSTFRKVIAVIFSPLTLPIGFAVWLVTGIAALAVYLCEIVINLFARFFWIPVTVLFGAVAILTKFDLWDEKMFEPSVTAVVAVIIFRLLVKIACYKEWIPDIEDSVFTPWYISVGLAWVALFALRVGGDVLHAFGFYMYDFSEMVDGLGDGIYIGPITYRLCGKLFGIKTTEKDVIEERTKQKQLELMAKEQAGTAIDPVSEYAAKTTREQSDK